MEPYTVVIVMFLYMSMESIHPCKPCKPHTLIHTCSILPNFPHHLTINYILLYCIPNRHAHIHYSLVCILFHSSAHAQVSGQMEWTFQCPKPIFSSPTCIPSRREVFAGCVDGSVYVLREGGKLVSCYRHTHTHTNGDMSDACL